MKPGRSVPLSSQLIQLLRRLFLPQPAGMTHAARAVLDKRLHGDMRGLAFGSESAAWLAARIGSLTCVEQNPIRHARIEERLNRDASIRGKIQLLTIPDHKSITAHFSTASLDILLMDGIEQAPYAVSYLPVLKPGGLLVIDNMNLEVLSGGSAKGTAQELLSFVEDWEYEWTGNKLKDTVIYYCPQAEAE